MSALRDIEEFLAALGELPATYTVLPEREDLRLRATPPGLSARQCCPLTAVYLHRFGTFLRLNQHQQAAKKLGLARGVAKKIVFAADSGMTSGLNIRMRQALATREAAE